MEVSRNATLSEPLYPSLSDGTFSLEQKQGTLALSASWKVEPAVLLDNSCHVSAAEAVSTLVPRFRKTLSSGTPRFTDLAELRQYVAEAGWASYPILAAGQWPLILPHFDFDTALLVRRESSQSGQWPLILPHFDFDSVVASPKIHQVCSGLSEGRLYIRWDLEPVERTEDHRPKTGG